jgi:hypothetical protein
MSRREIAFFPYTPPAVTREEALRPEFIDEGDEDLDVMVNEPLPHQCTPFEQMQEDRNNQVAKLQDAENQKDREWRVGVENITEGRAKR